MPTPKTCLLCAHYFIEPGTQWYSEITPGSDMDMGCRKDQWEWSPLMSLEEFREAMLTAGRCEDYIHHSKVPSEDDGSKVIYPSGPITSIKKMWQAVDKHLKEDKLLYAIKVYRDHTHEDLLRSKIACEERKAELDKKV